MNYIDSEDTVISLGLSTLQSRRDETVVERGDLVFQTPEG